MGVVPSTERDDRYVPLSEARLLGPRDVVDWAVHDYTVGWATWPDVWHLDSHGAVHCGYKGTSLDSARRWAEDPHPLLRSRRDGLGSPDGCTSDWLIIDSRPTGMWDEESVVGEADADAYGALHAVLASVGVRLLDMMIFDDQCNWWSVGQIITGHGCDHALATWPDPEETRREIVNARATPLAKEP